VSSARRCAPETSSVTPHREVDARGACRLVDAGDLRLDVERHGALGGHGHGLREAHLVVGDRSDAEPVDDRLDRKAHRQHPVREHAGQADRDGDVVTVVDGVEVA
jgi:hypothetical protein